MALNKNKSKVFSDNTSLQDPAVKSTLENVNLNIKKKKQMGPTDPASTSPPAASTDSYVLKSRDLKTFSGSSSIKEPHVDKYFVVSGRGRVIKKTKEEFLIIKESVESAENLSETELENYMKDLEDQGSYSIDPYINYQYGFKGTIKATAHFFKNKDYNPLAEPLIPIEELSSKLGCPQNKIKRIAKKYNFTIISEGYSIFFNELESKFIELIEKDDRTEANQKKLDRDNKRRLTERLYSDIAQLLEIKDKKLFDSLYSEILNASKDEKLYKSLKTDEESAEADE